MIFKKPADNSKRFHIARSSSRIALAVGAASALAMLAIVGAYSMLGRISYQHRVTTKQEQAITQLKDNIESINTLVTQYKVFNNANPNVLGVSSSGTSGDEGSNARIVLDALPSQYDFPALTTSIEKILTGRGIQPLSITGQDNSAGGADNESSPTPQPQIMEFQFSATSSYPNVKKLLGDFQRSIRPFKVTVLTLSGSNSSLTVSATVDTFYQPTKSLNISKQEVK